MIRWPGAWRLDGLARRTISFDHRWNIAELSTEHNSVDLQLLGPDLDLPSSLALQLGAFPPRSLRLGFLDMKRSVFSNADATASPNVACALLQRAGEADADAADAPSSPEQHCPPTHPQKRRLVDSPSATAPSTTSHRDLHETATRTTTTKSTMTAAAHPWKEHEHRTVSSSSTTAFAGGASSLNDAAAAAATSVDRAESAHLASSAVPIPPSHAVGLVSAAAAVIEIGKEEDDQVEEEEEEDDFAENDTFPPSKLEFSQQDQEEEEEPKHSKGQHPAHVPVSSSCSSTASCASLQPQAAAIRSSIPVTTGADAAAPASEPSFMHAHAPPLSSSPTTLSSSVWNAGGCQRSETTTKQQMAICASNSDSRACGPADNETDAREEQRGDQQQQQQQHQGGDAIVPHATLNDNGADDRTSKDYYFDSYAHHAIHEEMLKDEVRTRTYEMAIMQNKHLFQDKVVLDVGCGTGILSMFAAQAGAKHIYAVDCSSIIEQAQLIIDKNGFSDKITLIKGKVEEIELPVSQVDIIVSEWMGYFLLYESMLDTVLFARDKWLIPNGIIFPDKAVMYITAVEDGNVKRDRFDFWDDVYGFDMTPIKDIALKEPVVDVVDARSLVTDSVPILHLDILTCTKEDLEFTSKFRLQAQRNDYIHGLVAYFECAFTQIHKPIGFSTAPFARYTHWKQTIFYLSVTLTICAGEILTGEISCTPNKRNRRDLDIGLLLNFTGRHTQVVNQQTQYRLR